MFIFEDRGKINMEIYNKVVQNSDVKNKKNVWPLPGTGAKDLINTNYHVMVTIDLLGTLKFQTFYQEWQQNLSFAPEKQLWISTSELKNVTLSSLYSDIQILDLKESDNYGSLWAYMKSMGAWIFLTEDDKKAERAIKDSRKLGVYLRVYKLNYEGKLKNCGHFSIKESHEKNSNISNIDAFDLPNQISPIRRLARKNEKVPQKGDIVYTSNNQLIKLGDEFISNPQSITYQTDTEGIQAKIYQPQWLTVSYFEDKITRMLQKTIHYEGICWPIDLLRNVNGEFVGVLVPAAGGVQLKQLMSQQGLEEFFPEWDRRNLTHLTNVILDKIVYLQERNVLLGLVNPGAIFVKDENHVYFAEMDTYQVEGYPILAHEKVMQAPELQDVNDEMRLYTKQQDNYVIALLVFMILMPGKFPYNKGKNKHISESIKNMTFAFRYGKQGEEHGARELFGLWRFVWSHLGNEMKQVFYYTFQKDQAFGSPDKRRNAKFWRKKVGELEQELIDPYDKESLRLFPRTFKKFSGTKTIRCIKCGIEHPDFYYRYPDKKICNSCIGQPSSTYFVCKTCGNSYYYDYGTLFKYEKLVATKAFSMPTHCPYCRSDKRKCESCGKWVPIYRINDNNMCLECAKKERERIVKEYFCEGKCGGKIKLTQGEIDFHMRKFGKLPKYCERCREKRRKTY